MTGTLSTGERTAKLVVKKRKELRPDTTAPGRESQKGGAQ